MNALSLLAFRSPLATVSQSPQRLGKSGPVGWLRRVIGAIALLAASAAPAAPAAAQCGITIPGHFGGETTAVAQFSTNTLLVARGTSLELLDLSNPSAPASFSPPRRIGLAAPARKISTALGAPRAFVMLDNGDVVRVTVAYFPVPNISSPATIRSQDVVDILADGERVFIATLDENESRVSSYIDIYDNGPDGLPRLVRWLRPFLNGYGFDRLAKIGNILWAGVHEFESSMLGVEGYDVSNPAVAPPRVSTSLNNAPLGTFTNVSAMQAIGNRLLLSYRYDTPTQSAEDWLRAVDVSVPASPVWHTPADLNGFAACMSSTGNRLRISIPGAGVGTWDTTNPSSLVWLGAYFASYPQVRQMIAGASTDYWAAGRGGLMTMNVSNPASPSVRATLDNFPVGPSKVRQRGNTTAVLDYTLNTLRLYDYTLPEAQQHRSSLLLPNYSELLELGYLDGTGQVLACVATREPGTTDRIAIIDITNPAAPATLSTIAGVEAHLMSVTGSRLYVFTTAREFRIYELAQPLSPQFRNPGGGSYGGSTSDYTCMTSWGDASFKAVALGTGRFGLWLINTTSATAPLVSGIYNPVPNYRVMALAKSPNYLWVSAIVGYTPPYYQDSRLESLVVTNLASPVRRYLSSGTSGAGQPGWFDSLAFVANSSGNFLVGTRPGFDGETVRNSLAIWELLPFLFAPFEAVAYPIVNEFVPHAGGVGNIAPSADGSRVILCGGAAGLYQIAMPVQWAPGFALRPLAPQSACYGGSASFSALASGKPTNVSYQWFRSGSPSPGAPWVQTALTDGPTGWGSVISGAADTFLTISNIRSADARYYYSCRATNSCGSTNTYDSYLILCAPDFNCSGSATVVDIFAFLSAWFANDPRADFNGVGGVTVADIFAFLTAWFAGC